MQGQFAKRILFSLFGCGLIMHAGTPLETMETLRRAIAAQNWKAAAECFSDEIRNQNAAQIETRAFYLTDYWSKSITIHNLFRPIPMLSKEARFVVEKLDGDTAVVAISYAERRDKDVRLNHVTLVRDRNDSWKITELFGTTRNSTQTK